MPLNTPAWFAENPDALAALVALRLQGVYWDECARKLRKDHGYPYRAGTSLSRFYKDEPAQFKRAVASAVPDFKRTARDLKKLAKGETFLVTAAVNNCNADPAFTAACDQWQKYTGGKVLVNPILYKNPTRRQDEQRVDDSIWWDPELVDRGWMLQDEIRPHPKLVIMTTKPQATTNNPIPPRMESLTKDRSAIFCHPQLSMRTVATPQNELPKILYSTGAITQKHYSDTPTGDIAEFHHSLGGVIVEARGKKFHLREVTWDGERFIDIDTEFDPDGVWDADPAEAAVPGDIHAPYLHSPEVMRAIYGDDGIMQTTRAKRQLLHDLADMGSVNPYEMGKVLTRAALFAEGRTNLESELGGVREWLEEYADATDAETHVVASNHDAFLLRWLEKGERGVEPENRALYHHLSAEMLDYRKEFGHFPNPVELGLRRVGYCGDAKFLSIDEPFRILGVELGMHGHLGSNGSRGSAKGLARIGTRSMIGHSHSPMIWQGVYQVGHSSRDRHGYNHGPSSWLTTMALLLANGRRQMIHIISGDFRG